MEVSPKHYDFAGWATRSNLLCSDGRTIMPDAFKHHDGSIVPLVWNHQHNDLNNVLGKALLHSINGDMYAYCLFNDTESGQAAKKLVDHGDICSLSICANQLQHNANRGVIHGMIRELSLVLAGANPGAFIDAVMQHGEAVEDEAIIYTGEDIVLFHSEESEISEEIEDAPDETVESSEDSVVSEETEDVPEETEETLEHSEEKKEEESVAEDPKKDDKSEATTVKDVLKEANFTEEQENLVYGLLGAVLEDAEKTDNEDIKHSEGDDEVMKHNVFEPENQQENTLMHADIINDAIADARRFGSLRESVLQHAAINNITDIGELFPTAKDLNMPPEWIKEDESWVAKIMNAVHHTPFSRVRALFAQLDEEEARAQGYIKGDEKNKYMKLALLKRTTQPTTIYIKMAMDRDDVIDINDFDVVAWQRAEMRKQLDKELARAFLIGDGRTPGTDGKIDENCIVPVLTDNEMYTIQYTVTDGTDFHNDFNSASENDSEAKGVVRAAIKSRKQYKGSGKPTFFTTEDLLTELLLIEDQNGRRIYESEAALATAMRVKEIVTIPEMEKLEDVYGIIYNFNDYNTGADKGGSVNMFDDFDIDYNQLKYLMETRCSAANVRPKSAIVLKKASAAG